MDTSRNNGLRAVLLLLLLILGGAARAQTQNTCVDCHSALDPPLKVTAEQFAQDIHSHKGLTCASCHGGDPTKADMDAMSKSAGFRGKIERKDVPDLCGRCHSDSEYMKAYGIPTDQFAKYTSSVHHEAMTVRGDLSAPTCTTCHGNHGAAPPGVTSVQNVCSTCHVFQAQMYEKSSHKEAFQVASLPGCVVCHSNHGIQYPTDAKLGTGPEAVCMQCHSPGDDCDQARARMLADLTRLDEAIKSANTVLTTAESSGMEVSEARLEQDQARDQLTKARVTIHSFQTELVEQDIQAGLKIAAKTHAEGQAALVERNRRRKGLGLSLGAILLVLLGLRLYIRQIEAKEN